MSRLTLKEIREIEQRIKTKPSEDNVLVVWQEYLQLADQDVPRLIAEIKRLRDKDKIHQ